MTNFKIGDRVKVTANTNQHQFPLGAVVTIASDDWTCDKATLCRGMDRFGNVAAWYVRESDMIKV